MGKLSARRVETVKEPGRYSDGDNLYLVVEKSGAKRWLFMYRWGDKRREMGLGGLAKVGLSDARDAAADARRLLGKGVDPTTAKREEAARRRAAATTFGDVCDAYIEAQKPGWTGAKTEPNWRCSLETHAAALRPLSPDEITTEDVVSVLEPIWTVKPETAQKTQNRIERVLDAAKVKGLRTGENPARWRGHLEHLLSKKQKLSRGHHPALSFAKAPGFMRDLSQREGMGALALEFLVLTVARESMVLDAVWSEIDMAAAVWTIPAARMKGDLNEKAGEAFEIPLSSAALAVLRRASAFRRLHPGHPDLVFPSTKPGRPMSNATMDAVLDRMGVECVPHGFRSTFRDWAGDKTSFDREVVELALAHKFGDPTERAYRRSTALEKRRKLMDAWGRYTVRPARVGEGDAILAEAA